MTEDTKTIVQLLKQISSGTIPERRAAQKKLRELRARGLTVVSKTGATEEERRAFQERFDKLIEKACQIVRSSLN